MNELEIDSGDEELVSKARQQVGDKPQSIAQKSISKKTEIDVRHVVDNSSSSVTCDEDSLENGSKLPEIDNQLEAYDHLPYLMRLFKQGEIEKAREFASAMHVHRVTPALELLLKTDVDLEYKTFCDALAAYLGHLRLKKKKRKNFPIDEDFLRDLFDIAIKKGLFKPVAESSMPDSFHGLSVLEIMIKMTKMKDKLHLDAYILTALYNLIKTE